MYFLLFWVWFMFWLVCYERCCVYHIQKCYSWYNLIINRYQFFIIFFFIFWNNDIVYDIFFEHLTKTNCLCIFSIFIFLDICFIAHTCYSCYYNPNLIFPLDRVWVHIDVEVPLCICGGCVGWSNACQSVSIILWLNVEYLVLGEVSNNQFNQIHVAEEG